MKKTDTFADRRQEAEAAKLRRLEKFKAQDSREAVERASARLTQRTAQAEKRAAADLDKRNKAQIAAAQAEAAAEAGRLADAEQLKKTAEAGEAQAILNEQSRKAKRDARYASRKARS